MRDILSQTLPVRAVRYTNVGSVHTSRQLQGNVVMKEVRQKGEDARGGGVGISFALVSATVGRMRPACSQSFVKPTLT